MSGSIPPNLILSLVFGVGQIVVGGGLAWYGLTPARWRQWRAVLAGAGGVWFLVSGACEVDRVGHGGEQGGWRRPQRSRVRPYARTGRWRAVCCDGRAGGWAGGVLHRNGRHRTAGTRPGGK